MPLFDPSSKERPESLRIVEDTRPVGCSPCVEKAVSGDDWCSNSYREWAGEDGLGSPVVTIPVLAGSAEEKLDAFDVDFPGGVAAGRGGTGGKCANCWRKAR